MGWASRISRTVRNTVSSACKVAWNTTKSLGHLAAAVVTLNPTQLQLALSDASKASTACEEVLKGAVTIMAWASVAALVAVVGAVIFLTLGMWAMVGYVLCMAIAFCWKHVWKFLKQTGQKLVDAIKRIVEAVVSFVSNLIPWYVWALIAAAVVLPALNGSGNKQSSSEPLGERDEPKPA